MNEYRVWNKEDEDWDGWIFHSFEAAEKYVLENGGYDRFDIYEKLS